MWDTSLQDWRERLLAGRPLVPDLPLFKDEAERALRIFNRLRVPDMHGLPMMGEVAGPWLSPIVAAIFGSYDPETDRRALQEFFWLIPKKNGKSSTAAAIMVEALILNRRPEGEFVLVAPTKEIADISFKQAAGTVRADPELAKLFHVQGHYVRTITHRRTGATLKVKAADTDVITGGKQVGTMIDELHVLAAKRNAADIMVELRGALAARPDGFLITVTTQSKAPPHGVFRTELEKARAVRDGKLKMPLLPILYELPPDLAENDGWRDRKLWPAVNPNLGRSVDKDFLERELTAHEADGRPALALFASQHFNVQIGQTLKADGWPGADDWEDNIDPSLTLDELLRRSEVVTIGVDYGGRDDLFSLCVLGRERSGDELRRRRWLAWGHSWCHEIAIERRKSDAARYKDFIDAGELTVVQTLGQDVDDAAALIRKVYDTGLLSRIGMDPNRVAPLLDAIEAAGMSSPSEGDGLVAAVTQGGVIGGAAITAERRLNERTLLHADQAIVAWAVGNAKVEQRGNYVLITKQAAGAGKIDPLMALLDAAYLMGLNPEPVIRRSVYDASEIWEPGESKDMNAPTPISRPSIFDRAWG